ncbi:MAG: hypothetical protein AAFV90_26530 [Cyanobacteria bacterium J06634_5]
MQRSQRQKQPARSSKLDRAAQISQTSWAIASANKAYTALALSFLLASVVSVAHPKAGVRLLATNLAFGIGGSWFASAIGNTRLYHLQLDKSKMLEAARHTKAQQERREIEIAQRQRELTTAQNELEAAYIRLKTYEEGYKVKADTAATKAAQHEANKRITEAERSANRKVADSEKRLNRAIQEADATVKRMQTELAQDLKTTQAEADAKVLAIQTESSVAITLASEKVAAAEALAQKAQEDSRITIKEFSEQMELSRLEAERAKQTSVDKVMAIKSKAQQQEVGAHKYKETVHQVLDDERSKVNDRVQTLSSELARITAELTAQKSLVTRLTGPKFFNQSSLEGQIGNRIIAFLIGRKVMVSGVKIGETKYGEASFYFEPINCDLKEVQDQLEPLHLHVALNAIPSVSIEGDGTIKMTVRINSDRKPKASVIKRVSDRQLRQAFLDIPFGLRFTGYTGRGKSTLLNNVIWLYESDMGVRFTIFDPKVDFPSATYPNNKVYRGLEKCVANIDLIGSTVKARQDYKVLNDEQGVPIPAQHKLPKLFLIDECKDIHDAAALNDLELPYKERVNVKNFKFSIQKGLEVGRGLRVRVIYSTVTPDSSDFGFKNSVFKQSATVFLGDQCYEALGTKSQYLTTVSDVKKAQLRQEYDARVASTEERDKFIALFFNGLTNEIFFFSPPMPNAWNTHAPNAGLEGAAQNIAQRSPPEKMAEGVSPQAAQHFQNLAPKQPAVESSPALGRDLSAQPNVILSLAELEKEGSRCPDCQAHSTSFKSKRPRKSDSTVRMRCNTKECPSGGEFRVNVSDELKQ